MFLLYFVMHDLSEFVGYLDFQLKTCVYWLCLFFRQDNETNNTGNGYSTHGEVSITINFPVTDDVHDLRNSST